VQLSIDQIREAVKKHGSQRKAAAALRVPQSSLSDALNGSRNIVAQRTAPPGHISGRSLGEFREKHDRSFIVPKKIRAALAALGSGWEYEMPLAKLAGVSLADLSAFRAMFEDHIVIVDRTKRAWAGTKATADKMRAMVS